MNSRERVLSAIAHQQPDKVPVDLGSTPSSGISAIAYANLLKKLGRTELPVWIYDVVQQLAQPDMSLIDQFGGDVIDIGRSFNTQPSDWHETTMANGGKAFYPRSFNPQKQESGEYYCFDDDGTTLLAKMPNKGTFFDQTYFPYKDGYPDNYDHLDEEMGRVLWSRYVHSPWDHAGDENFWMTLREKALQLRATTDKALMIVCGCNLFEWGTFLRRMDNFLMDLLCDPDNVSRVLDELLKRHLATLEKVCASVGDVVDIIRFGDDLGMISGPFNGARDVSYVLQTSPQATVRLCEVAQQDAYFHPLLRLHLATDARLDRRWYRDIQSRTDQRCRHGTGVPEKGIREGLYLLGRRCRDRRDTQQRHSRAGARTGARETRHHVGRRRIRVQYSA
jgi:hypothetical protein